jgi:DtxR family Mn-dependent transcriptional regulator
MGQDRAKDEVLEFIWSEREAGRSSVTTLLEIEEVKEEADRSTLDAMCAEGLISVTGDVVTLTNTGETLAREAIRRHRLAERLLTEVLAMDEKTVEKNACSFEHTLTPEVAESICTLIGHPPTCPHGLPIPKGNCCIATKSEITPLVNPLDQLKVGETGRIIFIVSREHTRLDKLSTLGIVPGSIVHVHQKRPAFVLQLEETTLALAADIVKEIYVKRVSQ